MARGGLAMAVSWKAVLHIPHPGPPSAWAPGDAWMWDGSEANVKNTMCFKEDRARRKNILEAEGELCGSKKQGLSTLRCQLHPGPAPARSLLLPPRGNALCQPAASHCVPLAASMGGKEPAGKGRGKRRGERIRIKIILCRNLNEREKRGERRERNAFSKAAMEWRRLEPWLIWDSLLALVLVSLSLFKP